MAEARARLDALPAKYPRLFPKGPLPWGFQHDDGWSALIETLCQRINTILKDDPEALLEVLQVKEKFGGLRFYYQLNDARDETEVLIREAVSLAVEACDGVCERCGRPGKLGSRNGWLRTSCSVCRVDKT